MVILTCNLLKMWNAILTSSEAWLVIPTSVSILFQLWLAAFSPKVESDFFRLSAYLVSFLLDVWYQFHLVGCQKALCSSKYSWALFGDAVAYLWHCFKACLQDILGGFIAMVHAEPMFPRCYCQTHLSALTCAPQGFPVQLVGQAWKALSAIPTDPSGKGVLSGFGEVGGNLVLSGIFSLAPFKHFTL